MPTANDIYVSRYTGTKWAESLGFLSISSTGLIGINSTSPAAQLQITANAAGTIGCIIKAAASQTADLTQWQNSSGTVLSIVTAAGNVGIGTTNPAQKLEVNGGSIKVTGGGSIQVDTNGTSLTVGTGTNTSASIGVSGTRAFFGYDGANAVVQGVASKGIKFNVNNGSFGSGTAMTIDTAGNVGIGNAAPDYPLALNSATNTYISFRVGSSLKALHGVSSSADNPIVGMTSGDLGFRVQENDMFFSCDSGNTGHMVIKSSGRVGIGTASPGAMLQITSTTAGTIGCIIKAAASQSADLLQFQNSSATVIGGVTTLGKFYSGAAPVLTGNFEASLAAIYGFVDAGSRTGSTTCVSNYSTATYASDVTSNVYSFRSSPSTAAAAFTLGTLTHFFATDTSLGSGSALNNQWGFRCSDFATSSAFAFAGAITSATGKYNCYMSGTAQNYFAGNIGIGQSIPTAYLHIKAGTATANTAPLKFTTGTNLTAAEVGAMEYNNSFFLTNSDATRRSIVLAASSTKTTAGAPYTNDGYITMNINGTDVKVMTTA